VLKASFPGSVARRYVENFQHVQAEEKIVRLVDVSQLEIVVYASEADLASERNLEEALAQAAETLSASIEIPTLPGHQFLARLKSWETQADAVTQTFMIKFVMPAPRDVVVMPGMTATVRVDQRQAAGAKPVFCVPTGALVDSDSGSKQLWTMDPADMTAHARPVKVGEIVRGSQIEILEGLSEGDMVITSGVHYLAEGMPVRLLEEGPGR
jgi:RND family efflux transporter MFP subunit